MTLEDLDFTYSDDLVATVPATQSKVMWVEDGHPIELSLPEVVARIPEGDVFVINDTKVLKRRIFTEKNLEILFIRELEERQWEVLMPASKIGKREVNLPGGMSCKMIRGGRPQVVETSAPLTEKYFIEHGQLPLPPYIQKLREQRGPQSMDDEWYQTVWAEKPGSLAAPTASFHFKNEHLAALKRRGVSIEVVTLHVGLGTFLPITAGDFNNHKMHHEAVEVMASTWERIQLARSQGKKIWALGTTVARTLESCGAGLVANDGLGGFHGTTDLFIKPGYRFGVVDRLLTNFHQPRSTLLALVMAFAGVAPVKNAYQWACNKRFRLFSYGDLTVWK